MYKFTLEVPATTANLGPGYDTLGVALDYCNLFHVRISDKKSTRFRIIGEGAETLPRDESNLFYRALKEGMEATGETLPPLEITLENKVPLNRGMGSSATAVVGGLLAARQLSSSGMDEETFTRLAVKMEGHPDNVTAAYIGGVVINYTCGSTSRTARFIPPKPLQVVLAVPEVEVSTREARKILPVSYPMTDVVENLQRVSLLIHALHTGEYHLLCDAMKDRIHQEYRAKLIPGFNQVSQAGYDAGAAGVAISGSGSTVAAFCTKEAPKVARAMENAFKNAGVNCRTIITGIRREGARIVDIIEE